MLGINNHNQAKAIAIQFYDNEDDSRMDVPAKILVIEDDPISQRVVQLMLENMGYSVTSVAKGAQALAIYQDFDLIVSDVGLPDISGTEICKAIRSKAVKCDIPIIALTANNYNDEIAQAGFTEFMNKPVMQELLEKNVTKCLGAKRS